jgi:hypothetical protein
MSLRCLGQARTWEVHQVRPHSFRFVSRNWLSLSAIRRCLFPGPVYFSDVILADIGTSFAKVFGDAWQSIWMLKPGNSMLMLPVQNNWLRWISPTMMRYCSPF